MMSFVLASRGHMPLAVETAANAFEALDNFRADAVIYDWNRRAGALHGFAREVRAKHRSVCGVVVASSLDEPPEFQTTEAVDGYFTKPLAMAEVIVRVELVVRSRAS